MPAGAVGVHDDPYARAPGSSEGVGDRVVPRFVDVGDGGPAPPAAAGGTFTLQHDELVRARGRHDPAERDGVGRGLAAIAARGREAGAVQRREEADTRLDGDAAARTMPPSGEA